MATNRLLISGLFYKRRKTTIARLTVSQILTQIASTVNQEASAPAATSSEYGLWLQYLNRALFEWAEATDWECLRKNFYPPVTGSSTATIAMPLDFKKLAAYPVLYGGGLANGTPFPESLPEQFGMFNETDQYVTVRGDLSNGFNVIFHPATLASGASLEIQYFSMPTSLASGHEIPVIGDSQFLVDRSVAYIFESRSDGRFQTVEVKANQRLLNMVEQNNASKYDSYAGQNPILTSTQKLGWRMGRD